MLLWNSISTSTFDEIYINFAMRDIFTIFIVTPNRCTNVSNLFYFGVTLHVSGGLSVHYQEFTTVHTATSVCTVVNS